MSPRPTPMVTMTLSHIRPHVSRLISSSASSGVPVWVAPNFFASSSLNAHRVDGEDALGAGEAGALDGVGADAADADDGDVVAGLDLGGVDGRAPSGGDAAPDEAGPVEGMWSSILMQRRLVDDGVLRERAEAGTSGRGPCPWAWWREVWSAICLPPAMNAPRSHRFWWPVEQDGQRPHDGNEARARRGRRA